MVDVKLFADSDACTMNNRPVIGNPAASAVGQGILFPAMVCAAILILLGGCSGGVDQGRLPVASISDAGIEEGDAGLRILRFPVKLSAPARDRVTADYASRDGDALGKVDYDPIAGSLTFHSGEVSKVIDVVVRGDTDIESVETLVVTLSNLTGSASLGRATAFGHIWNDDYGPLNDTGITTCADAVHNDLACPVTGFPGQDGESGRDSTASDDSDGHAGFSFTKLDTDGRPLADQRVEYGRQPWGCVRDNLTGLIWEVKTTGGLRSTGNSYVWYSSDAANNGGMAGISSARPEGQCKGGIECTTEAYIEAVNGLDAHRGLCGYNDWRMPNRAELNSLVDFGKKYPGPTIDMAYFPNTAASGYWSAMPFAFDPLDAWMVSFYNGSSDNQLKSNALKLRLVRGGPSPYRKPGTPKLNKQLHLVRRMDQAGEQRGMP
ncbi:MAG TPA: DUF1566 domain-containing protein [Sedimenticola sp.]|nr:DUF1566 domain-containing protein [Sedimenticola sp.]